MTLLTVLSMASLHDLIDHCNRRLQVEGIDDYCPNGLQVEAGTDVKRLATAVTASLAVIEEAARWKADLLLVHHGYFWKNEPAPLVGVKGRRVAALYRHGISLAAYHLPLDLHPELGNNARLGALLEVIDPAPLSADGLLWGGRLAEPLTLEALGGRVERLTGRAPLRVSGGGRRVDRLAWCSGAAQGMIEQAAALGFPAYLSGEISESTWHLAGELGVHYLAAGHHATERYGVQALGEELARTFELQYRFIDQPNPV